MKIIDNIVCPSSSTFYNSEGHIIFDPPLYVQRYNATINCLKHEFFKKKINSIVEFGCAEMKLFAFLRTALMDRNLQVKLIDINEELLMRCRNSVQPLIMDHVKKREHELHVEIWQGDVSVYNPNFTNVDCVISLELIEHLYPNTLEQLPYQIFENLRPKIVIVSTPNSEYNKVFNLEPGKFRHDDHKFEWNRIQFQDWCYNICERFCDYVVQIEGIGKPPTGYDVDEIGYSSQFALFIRNDFMTYLKEQNDIENEEETPLQLNADIPCDNYKLLKSLDYPVFKDTRDMIQKINDEVSYHVNRYKYMGEQYFNEETNRTEVPVNVIARACWEVTTNEEEVIRVIRESFRVENDLVIIEDDYESTSEDQLEQEFEQMA